MIRVQQYYTIYLESHIDIVDAGGEQSSPVHSSAPKQLSNSNPKVNPKVFKIKMKFTYIFLKVLLSTGQQNPVYASSCDVPVSEYDGVWFVGRIHGSAFVYGTVL